MARLPREQIDLIKAILDERGELPPEWRWVLFPPEKQEYELLYAGKQREEDILTNTMAVPLQPTRTFGDVQATWQNRLIFGDNLQAMQYLRGDPDVRQRVKLVYIDPPFATRRDFRGSEDQKAYQDKVLGAAFLEFVRARLVLIKELLHPEGTVYVHIDWKKGHYIKVLMDELFGENRFRNDIAWHYYNRLPSGGNVFESKHDSLLVYTRSGGWTFHPQYEQREEIFRKKKQVKVGGKSMNARDENGNIIYLELEKRKVDDVWRLPLLVRTSAEYTGYPTQKTEELLARVISAATDPGDIVLDAFAGSGTTVAVAEKLGRRWIGIDSGKLAVYTIQKRMLHLRSDIGNKTGPKLQPQPFTLYNAGLYDFASLRELPWEAWRFFALRLFECKDKPHMIGTFPVDGERKGDPVLVFNWKAQPNAKVSEETVDDIHAAIGQKLGRRFYIIAPMQAYDFMQDYIVRDNVRYYALRIPYNFIQELHQRDFQTVLQARNATEVNDVQEAYGFSFIVPPEVEFSAGLEHGADAMVAPSGLAEAAAVDELVAQEDVESPASEDGMVPDGNGQTIQQEELFAFATITTKEFVSKSRVKGTERNGGKESLAMLLVDTNYDGQVFQMTEAFFGRQLETSGWVARLNPDRIGEQVMAIWVDHHGNEFKAVVPRASFGLEPLGAGGAEAMAGAPRSEPQGK